MRKSHNINRTISVLEIILSGAFEEDFKQNKLKEELTKLYEELKYIKKSENNT